MSSIEVTMPRLSETAEEITLLKWHVRVGQQVSAGDVLAEVETDKAAMELQSDHDGIVEKLVVEEDQILEVGEVVLVLEDANQQADKPTEVDHAETAGDKIEPTEKMIASEEGMRAIKASPLARRVAKEHHVDLTAVVGTGPEGRITKDDVMAIVDKAAAPVSDSASTASPSSETHVKKIPVSNRRRTIALRLLESKTTAPHFAMTNTVNADPLVAARTQANSDLESRDIKLSISDFIIRATALALAEHPQVNASWTDTFIEIYSTVNIGVAVSLPQEKGGGLVVPTLHNVVNMDLHRISIEARRLVKKAREQGLTSEEMSGGTFTVSNLGMYGIDHFEAIINPPQAAILAVGSILPKPVVRNDQIVIGHEMACTLSCDHRVLDGAAAAEFLRTFQQLLEKPTRLIE